MKVFFFFFYEKENNVTLLYHFNVHRAYYTKRELTLLNFISTFVYLLFLCYVLYHLLCAQNLFHQERVNSFELYIYLCLSLFFSVMFHIILICTELISPREQTSTYNLSETNASSDPSRLLLRNKLFIAIAGLISIGIQEQIHHLVMG